MCRIRRNALPASLALALSLALAGAASAQYREFTGKVDKIDQQKVIVDNRMGDKVMFERLNETEVSGQDKRQWRDLKKNDWVTVHWKMMDKPRKAYKVDVLPPKDEAGDDM
jgi:hypothetical protein